ncbi:rhomboid-related protein 4-like [Rhinatrema bivittatum]|uniref:rhomboid-related protein 4-like n=1 Tax=Rhinatrema bivittatum TaxID=194408 RepID=UPI00112C67D4|nr:rhomboid-related protein 4-like [Rhinatrema bivittatum]
MAVGRIPIVTLAVITLAITLYLHPLKAHSDICLSVDAVWNHRQWLRLLLAPFHHLNTCHLVLNMISFFLTGWYIEWSLGSGWAGYMFGTFSILVGFVYLLLNLVLAYTLEDPSYMMHCAIGFSGVLFSLKMVQYAQAPTLAGFLHTTLLLSLLECVFIHLFFSKASFLGHLAGILIGLAYTQGPLRTMMELLTSPKSARGKVSRTPTKAHRENRCHHKERRAGLGTTPTLHHGTHINPNRVFPPALAERG